MYKKVFLAAIILVLYLSPSAFSCSKELRECSNGRGVGRQGPNCEFAPCELPSSLDECDAKDGFWREWCIKDYAVETVADPQVCEKISDNGLKRYCYFEMSEVAKNINICSQMPMYQNECTITVSKTFTNPKICGKLSGKDQAECFNNIARNTLNTALCEKAAGYYYGDYEMRATCLRDIATKTGNTTLCMGLTQGLYREECLAGASKMLKDPKVCDELSGKYKAECYMNIGSNISEPELCLKAEGYIYLGADMSYFCLRNIAVKQGDLKFCENNKKKYGYLTKSCYRAFRILK